MADIWGFAKSTEKLIWLIRRKPQISTTAKVRRKFTLRERLQETPEPHSRNPIISPGLIEKLPLAALDMILDGLNWGKSDQRLTLFHELVFKGNGCKMMS